MEADLVGTSGISVLDNVWTNWISYYLKFFSVFSIHGLNWRLLHSTNWCIRVWSSQFHRQIFQWHFDRIYLCLHKRSKIDSIDNLLDTRLSLCDRSIGQLHYCVLLQKSSKKEFTAKRWWHKGFARMKKTWLVYFCCVWNKTVGHGFHLFMNISDQF